MDPNSNFLHDLGNPLQPATLAAPKRKDAPTPLEDTSAKKYKLDESILEQVQVILFFLLDDTRGYHGN
jgi:hypothetical protein